MLSPEAYRTNTVRAEHEAGRAVEAARRSRRLLEQGEALADYDVGRVVLALDAYSETSGPPSAERIALD